MGELRRHRRWITLLALAAVIGNIVAASLCCMPRASDGSIAGNADFPRSIVICTAEGLKSLVPSGSNDHAPAPGGHVCPMCVLVASFALAVAVLLVGLVALPAPRAIFLPAREEPRPCLFSILGFHSRGPPVLA